MLVYVTNIWNHYTTTIGQPLANILGEGNFRLVLNSPLKEDPFATERDAMKWKHDVPDAEWLVDNPDTVDQINHGEWSRLIAEADVAVLGAIYPCKGVFRAVRKRIREGKLTFFMNERFLKNYPKLWDSFNPMNIARWWRQHEIFSHENVHYLPISHFGVDDMRFYDAAHGRVWKWGYFPLVSVRPTEKPVREKMRIGWCGRMLPWKHVEYIVDAVALLPKEYRERCEVSLVGEGECRADLEARVKAAGLASVVTFQNYMPVADVRIWMEGLDVYILPSDRGEGWGVVLAEAMDKCNVPISCVEAGATLDLIDEGENGFVFEKADSRRISRKLMWLIDHPDGRQMMGRKAWETMQERSPEEAAKRLCDLIAAIKSNDLSCVPSEGLCSNIG